MPVKLLSVSKSDSDGCNAFATVMKNRLLLIPGCGTLRQYSSNITQSVVSNHLNADVVTHRHRTPQYDPDGE